jgi:hypothetical protein
MHAVTGQSRSELSLFFVSCSKPQAFCFASSSQPHRPLALCCERMSMRTLTEKVKIHKIKLHKATKTSQT